MQIARHTSAADPVSHLGASVVAKSRRLAVDSAERKRGVRVCLHRFGQNRLSTLQIWQ